MAEIEYRDCDNFIIYLTICGTEHEYVAVHIAEPDKCIRDQILSIVSVFELPKIDNGGNPIQYLLGQVMDEGGEPEILEFEDEDGREQTLVDYNIQSGDHLHLIAVPVAGGGTCIYIPNSINIQGGIISYIKKIFSIRDTVFSSVFSPNAISRGTGAMIQVYLYKDSERLDVIHDALQSDCATVERCYKPLDFKIQKGANVEITIKIGGLEIECEKKSIIWRGHFNKCCFYINVPKNFTQDVLYGEVSVVVDSIPVGLLEFVIGVCSYWPPQGNADVICTKFNKIFISYTHQDIETIKHLAAAYKAQGVDYFFDRNNLGGGDVYEEKIFNYIDHADLFVLCWSANAAKSSYVAKEIKRALKHAYPQLSKEKATLKIYPISINPKASYPESMKDIYNFIEL